MAQLFSQLYSQSYAKVTKLVLSAFVFELFPFTCLQSLRPTARWWFHESFLLECVMFCVKWSFKRIWKTQWKCTRKDLEEKQESNEWSNKKASHSLISQDHPWNKFGWRIFFCILDRSPTETNLLQWKSYCREPNKNQPTNEIGLKIRVLQVSLFVTCQNTLCLQLVFCQSKNVYRRRSDTQPKSVARV